MPASSTMKNAYRTRATDEETNMAVPQSFSFMCRQGAVTYQTALQNLFTKNKPDFDDPDRYAGSGCPPSTA